MKRRMRAWGWVLSEPWRDHLYQDVPPWTANLSPGELLLYKLHPIIIHPHTLGLYLLSLTLSIIQNYTIALDLLSLIRLCHVFSTLAR